MNGIGRMIICEASREIKVKTEYKMQLLSSIAIYTVTYLIVLYVSSAQGMAEYYNTSAMNGKVLILIGYLFWNGGILGMDASSDAIESDAKIGILESELQSPYPFWLLTLIRSAVNNLLGLLYFFVIILVSSVTIKITLITAIVLICQLFFVSLVSNLGMSGLGFIFAALSIHVKRVGQWATIIQTALLLIGNITIPFFNSLQAMIPFVYGVEISRSLYLHYHVSVMMVLVYVVVNFLWLLLGILLFQYSLQKEKESGSFELF